MVIVIGKIAVRFSLAASNLSKNVYKMSKCIVFALLQTLGNLGYFSTSKIFAQSPMVHFSALAPSKVQ